MSHTIHGTIVYLPSWMANFHCKHVGNFIFPYMDPVGVGGWRINVTDHTDLLHPGFVNVGRQVMSILRWIPLDPGSPCHMKIGVSNQKLSMVFRFHETILSFGEPGSLGHALPGPAPNGFRLVGRQKGFNSKSCQLPLLKESSWWFQPIWKIRRPCRRV